MSDESSSIALDSNHALEKENKKFTAGVVKSCANACNNISSADFDVEKARKNAENSLSVLGASNGLQKMLAAQMLSIHELQQQATSFARGLKYSSSSQYFTNSAIKLANCFVTH